MEILGLLSINQCNLHLVQCPKSHRTLDISFYFFYYICNLYLGMTFVSWQFCVAVNMWHSGATQRQQQSRVFPLDVCFATLTVAGSSNYSIEDWLVPSVSVHERERTVKTMCQIVTVFHRRFRKPFPRRAALFSWEKRLLFTGIEWFSLERSTNIPNYAVCRLVPLVPLTVNSLHTVP